MVSGGYGFARSVTWKWAVREIWSDIEQQMYSLFLIMQVLKLFFFVWAGK